jgi:hypothetical protein
MRIDLYSRIILTVIATCLVWLCIVLTPVGTALTAQGIVQDVRIVGVKHPPIEKVVTSALTGAYTERILGDWDSLPVVDR